MSLSKEEVQHIARLARIGLTTEEEERFQKELVGVFGLIEELKEAKVAESALIGAEREMNRSREDVAKDASIAKDIVTGFPTEKDGFNKVRAVF